ncbi:DUF2064 domain-containing protein [Halopseudomonas pachastrellae]|nr:DUF2064 domain-containing protein [Halopseudomonas pachastrellae]
MTWAAHDERHGRLSRWCAAHWQRLPALDTQAIARAADALHSHDTAIIPSEDGGYVLIGQRQPHPAPFQQMRWSHANVMADTRQRLEAAGLSLWEGEQLWDLDEPRTCHACHQLCPRLAHRPRLALTNNTPPSESTLLMQTYCRQ